MSVGLVVTLLALVIVNLVDTPTSGIGKPDPTTLPSSAGAGGVWHSAD